MLECKDLMIGDWVCYDGDENHECPVRIDAINTEDAGVDDDYYDVWEPIPLTPEILKKNGFKEYKPNDFRLFQPIFFNSKEYRDSDDYVSVFFTSRGFCFRSGSNISIALKNGTAINKIPCYVHKLQHALRLCGIEKEIVL